ncbi:hypothetical protein ACX40Y_04755 [Sphingomonas sp. RS6]
MAQRPGLDDPAYAAFAWRRFRRVLAWMAVVAVLAALAAEYWLYATMGELHIVTAIATFLGVFLTIMMAAALMGLMFLSSGSGHDDEVEDPLKGEVEID